MAGRVSILSDYTSQRWETARHRLNDDLQHMMIVINRLAGILLDNDNIINVSSVVGAGSITLAQLQTIATDTILGRDTAGTGTVEQLSVGGGLEFSGAGGIRRSALTGDVTAGAGSNSTTIAANAVTYAKMQDVTAASRLIGRGSAGGAGDPQEITLDSSLTMTGTTLSTTAGANAVTAAGALTNNDLVIGQGSKAVATTTTAAGILTFLGTPSSANLASAVTDETGSGALVFANTPTLVTPVLGVASATSINKVAITAPATSATLTIADGKTATINNTATITATDGATIAAGGGIVAGTYAPTFTNVANLDGTPTAATAWQYMRIGNVVTVSGEMTVDPTAAGTAQAGISLPIASNFAAAGNCAGTGASPGIAGQVMAVLADATNDRAELKWTAVDTTSQVVYVTFTYTII